MSDLRTAHGFEADKVYGWDIGRCLCGWASSPMPSFEDAVDAYGDHRADAIASLVRAQEPPMSADVRAEAIVAMTRVLMGLGWTLGDPDNEEDLQNPDVAEAYDVVAPLVRAQTGRDIAGQQLTWIRTYESAGDEIELNSYQDGYRRGALAVQAIAEKIARGVAGAGGDTP